MYPYVVEGFRLSVRPDFQPDCHETQFLVISIWNGSYPNRSWLDHRHLTFPGSRNTQKPQIWSETVFSIVRYEVSKKMETPPDYSHSINFTVTKYSL